MSALSNPDLLKEYRNGLTDAEIAEKYDLEVDEVARRLHDIGLSR
jgi:uncharacterized protein (DUF433 family)